MPPGNSAWRSRKHSRCNTTPQTPSIFHLLTSAVKLGQHHRAQRSSEPAPETLPPSEVGALHPTAAGKETGCFEKPRPGKQEMRALGHKETGGPGDTAPTAPPRQRSAQMLPAPAPAFTVRWHGSKASPAYAMAFLCSSCTFLTRALKSWKQGGAASALSHPSALANPHTTIYPDHAGAALQAPLSGWQGWILAGSPGNCWGGWKAQDLKMARATYML